jgi:hypothetical protein
MKKIFLLLALCTTFSYAQSSGEELGKALYYLLNKSEYKKDMQATYIREVLNQTVVINSSSNARFSGGNTRAGVKINLPIGTTKWYYRITLMNTNSYYSYPEQQTLFSLISNRQSFFVNNQTNYGVDFYVIDDNSINNFSQTGNENYRYYQKYSKLNTSGFIDSCDMISTNLWIGLKNPNITEGLKAIVEVVAFGNFN